MTEIRPETLEREGPAGLIIGWSDGVRRRYTAPGPSQCLPVRNLSRKEIGRRDEAARRERAERFAIACPIRSGSSPDSDRAHATCR